MALTKPLWLQNPAWFSCTVKLAPELEELDELEELEEELEELDELVELAELEAALEALDPRPEELELFELAPEEPRLEPEELELDVPVPSQPLNASNRMARSVSLCEYIGASRLLVMVIGWRCIVNVLSAGLFPRIVGIGGSGSKGSQG